MLLCFYFEVPPWEFSQAKLTSRYAIIMKLKTVIIIRTNKRILMLLIRSFT